MWSVRYTFQCRAPRRRMYLFGVVVVTVETADVCFETNSSHAHIIWVTSSYYNKIFCLYG